MTILNICKRIKEHRTKKGLTQKELANALFMDERNYAKFERGQKKSIDVLLLLSIADTLKVDIMEFLSKQKPNFDERENISLNGSSLSMYDELKGYIFQLKNDMKAMLAEQKHLKEIIHSLQLQIKSSNGKLLKD